MTSVPEPFLASERRLDPAARRHGGPVRPRGIYAGNGQVVSGGMNGMNQTMAHPLSWLTATGGVTFVRAA